MTRDEHLLTVLAEEAAEVIHRVAKMLRFGPGDTDPTGQEAGTAVEKLADEISDFIDVVSMLATSGIIPSERLSDGAVRAKVAKVEEYLRYAAERGTLTEGSR